MKTRRVDLGIVVRDCPEGHQTVFLRWPAGLEDEKDEDAEMHALGVTYDNCATFEEDIARMICENSGHIADLLSDHWGEITDEVQAEEKVTT